MADILSNQKGGLVNVLVNANDTITLASLALPGETITSVDVVQIFWAGDWNIARNGATVYEVVDSGHHNFAGHGVRLSKNSNTDIVCTQGVATGSLVLQLAKKSTYPTDYLKG